MACMDFDKFKRWILAIDQKVEIDRMKEKPLRYDVWGTTSDHISDWTNSGKQPDVKDMAPRIKRKLDAHENRIRQQDKKGGTTQADIFEHEFNREMSTALHEVMESVKGEADKARNNSIDISEITDGGILPALPLSRVAASIGRKIAFQKGYRFKRAMNEGSAAEIEAMYYDIGREAIRQLEKQGYLKTADNVPTIMDYIEKSDMKKDFPKNEKTRSDVLSVSLDEKKLGIGTNSQEAAYFLNRTSADLEGTDLLVITEKLKAAGLMLQPSTIVPPDTAPTKTDEELAQWDDGIRKPDPKTSAARKAIYEKPLYVNQAVHDLMTLLHEEVMNTGKSATQRINEIFGTRKGMVASLFGLKKSDDYSIDKKESVTGQNLSKTTPMDDLAEWYDTLTVDGKPAPLHMPMKIGRNGRLYYLNSILNPHASKQSRYMLTPGQYTIATGTADFDYLVHQVAKSLGMKTADLFDIAHGESLKPALAAYDKYKSANTLVKKMQALGPLARDHFPGVDYVTLLTGLQAIQDIRNPKDGKVTTEFTVSADATASGGNLTFMQALGTNPNVVTFMQRIGLLHSGERLVKKDLDDIYGLMSKAITDLIAGKSEGLGPDIGEANITGILQGTLNLLFKGGDDIRDLSKDPTMVFIYGQGKKSATETISRSLADRVIDSLDEPQTREYLSMLFGDKTYTNVDGAKLKDEKGLYKDIVEQLKATDLPQQLYDTMNDNINQVYLEQYKQRSQEVYDILKKLPADLIFKVLPAGAVLAGKKAKNKQDLRDYGMPLTKKVEVINYFDGIDDTVLTRRDKLTKTVMDVSTTHGVDAALLYHSIDKVGIQDGVVTVHDDIRSDVKTVRAVEAVYAQMAKRVAAEYDVHQQIMESIATYSPDLADSAEYIKLKDKIDQNVADKGEIISALFNDETDALIGDGKEFESFAKGPAEAEVDTDTDDTVQSTIPKGPAPEQDFGDAILTISEDGETVEVLAQQYWDSIQSRLDMVDKLKVCLS